MSIFSSNSIEFLELLPLLRYQRPPANTLQELYVRYPQGGEFGWYAVVQEIGSFAYWSVATRSWESMTISPENLSILAMKLKYAGEWSVSDSYNFGYSRNDLLSYNNSIFVNIKTITPGLSIDISNTEYWKCLYDASTLNKKLGYELLDMSDYSDLDRIDLEDGLYSTQGSYLLVVNDISNGIKIGVLQEFTLGSDSKQIRYITISNGVPTYPVWKSTILSTSLPYILGSKVDKVAGKGLSTNDFTDSYKVIVDTASSKSDLSKLKLNLMQLINSTLTERIEVLQNQINTTPASQEIDTNFLIGENGEYVFDEKGNHVTLSNDSKSFLVIESGEFILFNNNKITL